MSDFGLEIFPEIGGAFSFDGNTTLLNFTGEGTVNLDYYVTPVLYENGMQYVDIYHYTPDNSDVVLIHNCRSAIDYGTERNKDTNKLQYYPKDLHCVLSYKKLDNSRIRIYMSYNMRSVFFDYSVFYYLRNDSVGSEFGISVSNNDGFYNIGNNSIPLPLINSEIINFNGSYIPPVADPKRTISFFSWNDPNLSLIPESALSYNKESFGKYLGYNRHGELWRGNTEMKVCTFGYSNLSSEYGIDIYNGYGNKVFNSKCGVLKNMKSMRISAPEYNNIYPGVNPMVFPVSLGGRYLQTGRYENGYQIDFGINMYNSCIGAGYTYRKYQAASHGALTAVAPVNVYYINCDDYF